jgi:hypothetical protein
MFLINSINSDKLIVASLDVEKEAKGVGGY